MTQARREEAENTNDIKRKMVFNKTKYILFNDETNLRIADLFACLFTIKFNANSASPERIFVKNEQVSGNWGSYGAWWIDSNTISFSVQNSTNNAYVVWNIPVSNNTASFKRIALKLNITGNASGDLKAWVNNVLVTPTVTANVGYSNAFRPAYNSNPLSIGCDHWATPALQMSAEMYEMAFYKTDLANIDCQEYTNSLTVPSGHFLYLAPELRADLVVPSNGTIANGVLNNLTNFYQIR